MWRAGPADQRHLANDGGSALDGLATMDDGRGASLLRSRTFFPTAVTGPYTLSQTKVAFCNPPESINLHFYTKSENITETYKNLGLKVHFNKSKYVRSRRRKGTQFKHNCQKEITHKQTKSLNNLTLYFSTRLVTIKKKNIQGATLNVFAIVNFGI